jgi:ABC-type transport system involved in multi-copper enzyme maturation permease subunit
MLLTIVRKELALHVLTLRFQLGFLVCVGLIGVVAWIGTVGYEKRVADHDAIVTRYRDKLDELEVFSDLACNTRVLAARKPRALAVFSQGIEGRMSDHFEVAHCLVPGGLEGMRPGDPFTRIFSQYDAVTVLQVILSFLALLFAYDAVSGEREDGTLTLVLSNHGSRALLLLGKYLGGMLSLAPPLVVSFLVAVLIMEGSPHLSLGAGDWQRLGIILALSLLYLSLFLVVGLLLSALTRHSSSSLLWAALVWMVLVIVYPAATLFAVDQLRPMQPLGSLGEAMGDLGSEFEREVEAYLSAHGRERAWEGFDGSHSSSSDGSGESVKAKPGKDDDGVIKAESLAAMEFARQFYAFQEPLRAEYADRKARLTQAYLEENLLAQERLAWGMLRLSPAGMLAEAASAAADTDLDSYLRFVDQAGRYRRDLIAHLEEENAFGSDRWFYSPDNPVQPETLPRFAERPETPGQLLGRLAPTIALLAGLNGLLFVIAVTAFGRVQVQ